MPAIIADPQLTAQLIAERRSTGRDHWDEVWNGVYSMSPAPNNEHQGLGFELAQTLFIAVKKRKLGKVQPGCNVSDRPVDWSKNFRVPDVAVFLKGNQAENRRTHWYGGPDLAIEIVSEEDRTWEKIPFYASVGTRELLIVDRDPWMLTLFRLHDAELREVGRSTPVDGRWLESTVVSLAWRLVNAKGGPAIDVHDRVGQQDWTILSESAEEAD